MAGPERTVYFRQAIVRGGQIGLELSHRLISVAAGDACENPGRVLRDRGLDRRECVLVRAQPPLQSHLRGIA